MLPKDEAIKRRDGRLPPIDPSKFGKGSAYARRKIINRLLEVLSDLGTQDLYTDAPEYKGRVTALANLCQTCRDVTLGIVNMETVHKDVMKAIRLAATDSPTPLSDIKGVKKRYEAYGRVPSRIIPRDVRDEMSDEEIESLPTVEASNKGRQ